ncbi:hypothetical protein ABGB07_36215 [Micromonosporaceae bacterium B7E4]
MSAADRACPDYPNECMHPWAHARTYDEVKATQGPAASAPSPSDLSAYAAAVRLRDRATAAAIAHHERAGLAPSGQHARATYDAFVELIREDERVKVKRSLSIAVLAALRSIPDGEIRNGCVVHDGAKVRERLRSAWLAIDRDGPGKGFTVDSPAPVVSAEGSGHPQPATEPYDESRVARRMDRWTGGES